MSTSWLGSYASPIYVTRFRPQPLVAIRASNNKQAAATRGRQWRDTADSCLVIFDTPVHRCCTHSRVSRPPGSIGNSPPSLLVQALPPSPLVARFFCVEQEATVLLPRRFPQ